MASEPIHIEVTSYDGASKWIRNVVSHTREQIRRSWEDREKIVVTDGDGCQAAVDMDETYMIRFQDEQAYQRRSHEVGNRGPRR